MPEIPRDPANTDLFNATCIHGREAAQIFCDTDKFQRHAVLPRRVVTSLFGKGAIHTLDDAAHRQRKATFLSLMGPESLERLMTRMADEWRTAILRWEPRPQIVLFDEVPQVLAAQL